jgi:hypothetical protein
VDFFHVLCGVLHELSDIYQGCSYCDYYHGLQAFDVDEHPADYYHFCLHDI